MVEEKFIDEEIGVLDATIKAEQGIVEMEERKLYDSELRIRTAVSTDESSGNNTQYSNIYLEMENTSTMIKLNLKQTKQLKETLERIIGNNG